MENLVDLVWLIPALPLAGFLVLVLLGRRMGEPLAGWFATLMCGGAFAATVLVFLGLLDRPEEARSYVLTLFEWIPAGGFSVDIGFLADPLSLTMALFITGVGTLIHLYSIGYMHGDPSFSKFFLYLNLFAFSMLTLVLGDNLVLTFLGWEGVGACSYFLISFWFANDANASAGKKAFVTNRIGDFGFMLAIFLAFASVGTVSYVGSGGHPGLLQAAPGLAPVTATAIALLLFLGAAGKSAQFPLYVWLPDAMAGPTPVSALIHAATMVTAGVFLMTRANPILGASYDWAPDIIAWVGVGTALFAATIAVAQNDIKKVLAYSTVSQLGYMFLAVGLGAYVPAIFHMVTHAFFKALLFLGSGSVIHGMSDEQDMRKMGGLKKLMPITAFTFIFGWLAIAGVPPFAGFWSKDEILLHAFAENIGMYVIGLITALLTAFYMSRQVYLVFFGDRRWEHAESTGDEAEHSAEEVAADDASAADADVAVDDHGHGHEIHPHESPWIMTVPLIALAGLTLVGGGLNLPFGRDVHLLERWLEPVVGANEVPIDVSGATQATLAVVAVLAAALGITGAALIYLRKRRKPIEPEVLAHGWYVDSSIASFMGGPGRAGFEATSQFDAKVIDGAVNGVGGLVRGSGRGLRRLQPGFVRSYALGLAAGAVIILGVFLSRIGF